MKDLTLIGKTLKPRGVGGWLKVKTDEPYWEDLLLAKVLFIQKGSHAVPYFVEKSEQTGSLMIKLEEVDSKETAQAISGLPLYLRNSEILPDEKRTPPDVEESFESLIGFSIDVQGIGKIGKIEQIIEFPQQEMAFLIYQEKELMIPLNPTFVIAIHSKTRTIEMDLPEGLLDLSI